MCNREDGGKITPTTKTERQTIFAHYQRRKDGTYTLIGGNQMNDYIFNQFVVEMKELYITTLADASNLRYLLEAYYGLDQLHVERILSASKDLIDQHLEDIHCYKGGE